MCEVIQVVNSHIPVYIASNLWVGELIDVLNQQPVIDGQTQL